MKKVAIIMTILLGTGVSAYSQEKNPKKTEPIKVVKIETNNSRTGDNVSPEQEIININAHLEALDQKEAWIRQNPQETQIATENGWFTQAEETRIQLRARIKELEK
jgi:hypothetical protein